MRTIVRLCGVASGSRDAATARVRDAFGDAGAWITDVRFFSGVQTVFTFEVAPARGPDLARALVGAGLALDDASRATLERIADAPADATEVQGTLAVIFAHGDPDLTHEVPKVPG